MMREPNRLPVAILAGCLALTGCSATVAGTPVVDPAAAPKPETGSYPTAPRTIGVVTQEEGLVLEGNRMAEVIPMVHEVEPAFHLRGRMTSGAPTVGDASVKRIFGDAANRAIGSSAEVQVVMGAGEEPPGAKPDFSVDWRGVSVAVIRMPDEEAAARAVGADLLAGEKDSSGKDSPKKLPAAIPGHERAVAYTQDFGQGLRPPTVAYLAHKRYVIGVYGDFSVEQIRTVFDRTTVGLDGFSPTSLGTLGRLRPDPEGVTRLTLAPERRDTGYSVPVRIGVLTQTDVSRSVKTFADAGVDVIGVGGSTVYRARDESGARHVADEFVAETKAAYKDVETETVKGVPGATCLTFRENEFAKTKNTYCVAPVGRYLGEFTSAQRVQAIQAIGAQYLILQSQK
ncbi:hypothetical protein [Tsukamurella sp. 1534]|uniref:DUF7373 family lipoprotein n=1 Tax=Tsukamurella sp. 1534 TaxID=1151061 RepID=UPI000314AF76|nr:hypothetical protein [Tsukamurella sp. 1534]